MLGVGDGVQPVHSHDDVVVDVAELGRLEQLLIAFEAAVLADLLSPGFGVQHELFLAEDAVVFVVVVRFDDPHFVVYVLLVDGSFLILIVLVSRRR